MNPGCLQGPAIRSWLARRWRKASQKPLASGFLLMSSVAEDMDVCLEVMVSARR